MNTSKKIYFSGSIRGGRQDVNIYSELILELKKYGTVLTEHIGHETIDHELSDPEIYEQDMNWLREADIIVAEGSTPSLGVGYEIGRAVAMGKRVVCLYRTENQNPLSAMINGAPEIDCFTYGDIEEAKRIIENIGL